MKEKRQKQNEDAAKQNTKNKDATEENAEEDAQEDAMEDAEEDSKKTKKKSAKKKTAAAAGWQRREHQETAPSCQRKHAKSCVGLCRASQCGPTW